jgi:hypothetical protein
MGGMIIRDAMSSGILRLHPPHHGRPQGKIIRTTDQKIALPGLAKKHEQIQLCFLCQKRKEI